MSFLRKHWADIGLIIAVFLLIYLFLPGTDRASLKFITLVHFWALLLHQFEEYRFPGYFPGMINTVIFKSSSPEKYPLNPQSAFIINVPAGWTLYLLGIIHYKLLWLNIALMVVSTGNCIGHLFVFNIKGRTFYNPGMLSVACLFLPLILYFFYFISKHQLAVPSDYIRGFIAGALFNVGILLSILWMKRRDTPFRFGERQLIPKANR